MEVKQLKGYSLLVEYIMQRVAELVNTPIPQGLFINGIERRENAYIELGITNFMGTP